MATSASELAVWRWPFCSDSTKISERIHLVNLQSSGARFAKWELIAGFSANGI
jgi:hypothetical protein